MKLAYTAGEAIGPEIFTFFRSLGINIKQLYGQTEATVFVCIQPDGDMADTVGKAAPGVELFQRMVKCFTAVRGFPEYFKNPEATAKTKSEEGWRLETQGFSENGHLMMTGPGCRQNERRNPVCAKIPGK